MKLLDERGIGTVWSICKEKFALAGHTHNYAGSGSPGGSANSAIGVVDYGQTDKTIQIGYSGSGITGDQIKYIAGYTDGSGNVNAKIKDVSKDALRAWLGLGSLAYSSSSIPTNLSLLNNDKGFVTGSVSGNTITINGVSTTWTNTWRGVQDNLTSSSTSDSLSANQGRILKSLVDGKANSSDLSSYSLKSETVKNISNTMLGTSMSGYKQILQVNYANGTEKDVEISNASGGMNGFMSASDKNKLDNIAAFANNYTLPTASTTALGGIKVSGNANGSSWPICVNSNGLAETKIQGLVKDGDTLSCVRLGNETRSTYYSYNVINIEDRAAKKRADISFPLRSGTFALTSDLSDVCKFNFVNSISECVNGKINCFLNRDTSNNMSFDIKDFENCGEGTILFLTVYNPSYGNIRITNSAHNWYFNMKSVSAGEHYSGTPGRIMLVTIKSGEIYVFYW